MSRKQKMRCSNFTESIWRSFSGVVAWHGMLEAPTRSEIVFILLFVGLMGLGFRWLQCKRHQGQKSIWASPRKY